MSFMKAVEAVDPEVYELIRAEEARQVDPRLAHSD